MRKNLITVCFVKFVFLLVVLSIICFTLWGVIYAKDMKNWLILKSYSIDLDNDKRTEKIILASEVEIDKNGKINWDDGQWWKLSVYKDKEEILFKEYVTLGSLQISIGYERQNSTSSIILLNDTDDSLEIIKFYYNKKTKAYKKDNILFINKQVRSNISSIYLKPEEN